MDPVFIGHRGARFEAPENTLPGFRYAIEIGIQALEFDVRMSTDENLVIIHDETVDRTTNGSGRVSDLTLAELQALDARTVFPTWPEPCVIPTLDEVLATVSSVPDLIVEIKSDSRERLDRIVPATVDAIESRGLSAQATITSFDPVALEILQRVRPSIRHGFIGRWDDRSFLDTSLSLGCTQVDANIPHANPDIVAEAKSLRMRVVVWPCNSQQALEEALAFAPDLICTDEPTAIRALFQKRARRPPTPASTA
jgi:glycerophosphoryl diester phosphodiesterase